MRFLCIFLLLFILPSCRSKQEERKNNPANKETVETTYSYHPESLIDIDPIEHDTTNDIPFVGKYTVNKYLTLQVMSEISSADAEKFVGRNIEYRKGQKLFDSNICNFDSVKVQRFTDADFQAYTRGSGTAPVSFTDLEYAGDSIALSYYRIEWCGFGANVIYFDPENIRIDYKGSYFTLKKIK
jgi:hypothetical protein